MPAISFFGGAGTVTGSKFLVETGHSRILVDCGLFQGYKQLRLRNWKAPGFDPTELDCVILTHAHLDHSGYLPALTKLGFDKEIHCTELTRDLCEILLPDAARIQEYDAQKANQGGYSRHRPARPLFTEQDAQTALRFFTTHPFNREFLLSDDTAVRFSEAGHILGAAVVQLQTASSKITFSGDLGRYNCPLMRSPEPVRATDYLVVESTYGGSVHPREDPEDVLEDVILRTVHRGGMVLVPSFAVGRAQLLLHHLNRLMRGNRIPKVPIYLDSPMAINASDLFCRQEGGSRLSRKEAMEVCSVADYVSDHKDSEKLASDRSSKIVISASGMAAGGRVLNHLKHCAPDPRNTVLFAGYQAGGTRGARMLAGADRIKIHGAWHKVRAEIMNLHMLSAHADSNEIMQWLSGFETAPRETFIVHGEPEASDLLRLRIEEELGWKCTVPEHGERAVLG